jgi:hypothetical protein
MELSLDELCEEVLGIGKGRVKAKVRILRSQFKTGVHESRH